jgi:SAM-dependent methyltransferase
MALERIDPIEQENRFCVDHLLRYLWAQPLVADKRVLDVACGSGFGCALLAHGNAAEVVGVDRDARAIQQCAEQWAHPRVRFQQLDLEALPQSGMAAFDRILTFETLEHVDDPARALDALAAVLKPDGILLGSVPGETDWNEVNEFHLHAFRCGQLQRLLQPRFRHFRIYRQRYQLASRVELLNDGPTPAVQPVQREQLDCARLDFGRAPQWADTFLFAASQAELPQWDGCQQAQSRQAWLAFADEYARADRELRRLSAVYRKLFFEHGDLKRRFTNVLAWGQHYHDKATGKPVEGDYLKQIEQAQSARERDLRGKVDQLQQELESVRAELAAANAARPQLAAVRDAFCRSVSVTDSGA